jgi:carboxymethylenebutenolidase
MRTTLAILCLLLPACSSLPSSRRGVALEPVSFPSGDTTLNARVIRPAGTGPFPPVVVVHGDFGPTSAIQANATRLADAGFLTLVVDLYRGEKVSSALDAHIMDRGLPEERVRGDLKAGVDYLLTRKDVRPGSVGIIGFDSGGGNALDFALVEPRISAVVNCYGRLTTDPELLRSLHASVLGIFAEKDVGIDESMRQSFVRAMEKAGKKVAGMHVFAGCEHGFLVPGSKGEAPKDKPPADPPKEKINEAWERIVEYLRAELGK